MNALRPWACMKRCWLQTQNYDGRICKECAPQKSASAPPPPLLSPYDTSAFLQLFVERLMFVIMFVRSVLSVPSQKVSKPSLKHHLGQVPLWRWSWQHRLEKFRDSENVWSNQQLFDPHFYDLTIILNEEYFVYKLICLPEVSDLSVFIRKFTLLKFTILGGTFSPHFQTSSAHKGKKYKGVRNCCLLSGRNFRGANSSTVWICYSTVQKFDLCSNLGDS